MSLELAREQSTTSQESIRNLLDVVVDSDETFMDPELTRNIDSDEPSTESDLTTQQEHDTFHVVNWSSIGKRLLVCCNIQKVLLFFFIGFPVM